MSEEEFVSNLITSTMTEDYFNSISDRLLPTLAAIEGDGDERLTAAAGIIAGFLELSVGPSEAAENIYVYYDEKTKKLVNGHDLAGIYKHMLKSGFTQNQKREYMMFRPDTDGRWEDKLNVGSGRWVFNFLCDGSDFENIMTIATQIWFTSLFIVIERYYEYVTTSVIAYRPAKKLPAYFRLSLWISNVTPEETIVEIGTYLKNELGLLKIEFTMHSSEFAESKYILED